MMWRTPLRRRRAESRAVRLLPAALAVLVAGATLSGCGSGPANRYAVEPAPAPPGPHLDAAQAGRILAITDKATAAAWRRQDPQLFGGRASGPYLAVSAEAMRLAAKRKQKQKPSVTRVERSLIVIPADQGWPRFFLTVGIRGAGTAPVVEVFRAASARHRFARWAELTSTDPARIAVLEPRQAGLLMTPEKAVQAYARLLTTGDRSVRSRFTADEFAAQVRRRAAQEAKGLKEVATVSSTHRMAKDGVLALQLEDGSALVIGRLTQEHLITVKKGSGSVTLTNADIVALLGKDSITKRLSRRAVEVVAIRVPPKGMGKATVVAAEKGDVEVTGS
jgi:hypothetical protein